MFDLEIVLPVCISHPVYKQRYFDFQKHGFFNIDGNIHLTLVCGPDESPELDGWHPSIKVDVIKHENNHVASKVAAYYLQLAKKPPVDARWYLKVDDDSITDIKSLLKNLDAEYSWDLPEYVCCGLNNNLDWIEFDVLKKYNLMRWVSNPRAKIWHEWECCALSNSYVKKMNRQDIVDLWQFRASFQQGSSDQTMGIVAKILRIVPSDAYFMSKDAILCHSTAFGGTLSHVHDIAPDRNAHFLKMYKQSLYYNEALDQWRMKNGSHFEFIAFREGREIPLSKLEFLANGKIIGGHAHNEALWSDFFAPTIEFFTAEGSKSSVLKQQEDGSFKGPFLFDDRTTHILRPLK